MLRQGWIALLATLALSFLSTGVAQEFARLLPAETFFALGTQGLAAEADRLEPFISEFERLDLASALGAIMSASEEDAAEDLALPEGLEGVGALDLLGQEAWLGLSAASFSPLPALTLIASLSSEASLSFAQLIAEEAANPQTQSLEEGGVTFYQVSLDDPESPVQVIAYAQAGDLLVLSSNPEVLRGVLRRYNGASEPSLQNSEAYMGTVGRFEAGQFYGYFDLPQIADIAAPYAQGLGFDQLIERLISAFKTAGVSGGVARVTDGGFVTEGFQAVNPGGGDSALYNLLTAEVTAARNTLRFAPADALSYAASYTDLRGWWDYLNGLAASSPELGGDLDQLLGMFVGINLRETLFNWTGTEFASVTTGLSEVVEPGVPSANLLGESVSIIEATDEAAAQAGLASLFQTLSGTIASFTDPTGGPGDASMTTLDIGGVEVQSFAVAEGITLNYAVVDGYAFIGTSDEAMRAVLETRAGGSGLANTEAYQTLQPLLPESASSVSLSNTRETLIGTANQVASQLQLTAGLGGASNLDFDAVTEAADKLEAFLTFIAERASFGASYSSRQDGGIYSYGETQISW